MNDPLVATIIDMALDDLAEGHADLPAVLRLVATVAWQEGQREATCELSHDHLTSRSVADEPQSLPYEHPALRLDSDLRS